ncbi:MAG: hypothetical protein R2787_07500 [Saprospiraceae bacterium]
MKRIYYLLLIPLLLSAWQLPAQLQVSFDPSTTTLAVGEEKSSIWWSTITSTTSWA